MEIATAGAGGDFVAAVAAFAAGVFIASRRNRQIRDGTLTVARANFQCACGVAFMLLGVAWFILALTQ